MDSVITWTGRTACALQGALRLTNESFAVHLGVAVRTVAAVASDPAPGINRTVVGAEIDHRLGASLER
jgi:hypothetical protein